MIIARRPCALIPTGKGPKGKFAVVDKENARFAVSVFDHVPGPLPDWTRNRSLTRKRNKRVVHKCLRI